MTPRPEDLQEQIDALKNKTEQNRKMAQEANELAEDALKHISESDQVSLEGPPSHFQKALRFQGSNNLLKI